MGIYFKKSQRVTLFYQLVPTLALVALLWTRCYKGDGNVSFEEFVSILSKSMSGAGGGTSSAEQEERELRDAFRVFDKHNRGYICASDLRAVLQCLGEDLSEEESEWLFMCLRLKAK